MSHAKRLGLVAVAAALAACSSSDPVCDPVCQSQHSSHVGVPVTAMLTAEQQAQVDLFRGLVATTSGLGADQLVALRAVPFRSGLGYDPLAAVNLGLVQGSALALDGAELAALGTDGFVVTDRHRYPHFAYGYQTIYSQDLPVFVSADSILQAVHQSYDAVLAAIEVAALAPELETLLTSMRTRLQAVSALDAETRADADLFLAVALSLLRGSVVDPAAGACATELADLVALAQNASDVHTQPTDEAGNWVGKVLHVGTGYARLMVMTAETCSGPRAYAGVVSSYHQVVTDQFQRLTDADWASRFASGQSPPDVPWLADVVVR